MSSGVTRRTISSPPYIWRNDNDNNDKYINYATIVYICTYTLYIYIYIYTNTYIYVYVYIYIYIYDTVH